MHLKNSLREIVLHILFYDLVYPFTTLILDSSVVCTVYTINFHYCIVSVMAYTIIYLSIVLLIDIWDVLVFCSYKKYSYGPF